MKLRYYLLLIVSLIALLSGTLVQPALAQATNEPTGFKNVTVWVYPEYDDPRLLVMLEGKIVGAALPAKVRFLIPTNAELAALGSKDAQGAYSRAPDFPPQKTASNIAGWDEISYTLPTNSATFRVEYYDNAITGSPDKKISYDFRWLYPISDLNIVIQQPSKATNFSVSPPGIKTTENNFNVVTYTKNNLTLDPSSQPLHFDISYTKTDLNPSVQNANTVSSSSSSNTVALIIIGVALVIVAVFLVLFLIKRRPGPRAKLAPRFDPARPSRRGQGSSRDKFCNQCGHLAGKSGKFCQNCGNKLD